SQGPANVVGQILSAAADQVSRAVQPAAVAAVATTFTFPLALMLAVLLFLLVQNRVDERDPKLRVAPHTAGDTVVKYKDEVDL
ncbi:MAG: hypothetical protein M3R05_02090, partial [Chloroflexota bacterium]|nr:hypothetical protein [Chloroflexota bacterium]